MEPPRRGIGEGWRKLAHLSTLLTLPLFRRLEPSTLLLLTAFSLVAAWPLGPLVFSRIARPGEGWRRFSLAVASFPLGVLLLLLLFPGRPEVAAGSLAVLAAGDAAAGLIGRRARGWRLPWNQPKSVAGSAAFICGGLLASGWAFSHVSGTRVASALPLLLPAVLVAAIVEGIPSRLGDNLPVLLSSGLLLGVGAEAGPPPWDLAAGRIPLAVVAVGLLAVAGLRAGAIDRAGAAAGSVLGGIVFLSLGPRGFLPLALFVVLGSLASRLREGPRMARSARHALANLIVPAYIALLAWLDGGPLLRTAYAGALAAALSDTISGEVGMRIGGTPRLLVGFRSVPRGTNGAVTSIGTIAGALAALFFAAASSVAGLFASHLILSVALAGFAGDLLDSLLGATLESRGVLGNEEVNFLASFAGAVLAALAASLG